MEFKTKTLSNGLTLIGEINENAESAAVGFFVKTGSRDETPEVNGVSHFLEHMLFKGTEKLGPLEVNRAFDDTGAQFNAFTSEECTVYYAAVLPEYLSRVIELWTQLMRPALRDADFDMEKNVIKEEIGMYKDMPSFDVIDRCRTLHFGEHPCGNSVLGSEQSIDALTAAQMRSYFESRYAPNNIVFACAGNFDCDAVFDQVEQACGDWVSHDAPRELTHSAGTKAKQREEKAGLVREHVCLISQGVSAQDPRRFAAYLLASIAGDSLGSRYYWEIVDKAMAEEASMQFGAMDGTGAFYTYVRCSSENTSGVMNTVERILAELKQGVTEDELAKAKNKVLSSLVLKNELSMGRLVDLGFNWLYLGAYRPVSADVEDIKAVTTGELRQLACELKLDDFTRLALGPVSSQ